MGLGGQFGMLNRHLTLRLSTPGESDLDRRVIFPAKTHSLLGRGPTDSHFHAREPASPHSRRAKRRVEFCQRHGDGLALADIVIAAALLTHLAKSADALLADSHHLRPPGRRLVLLPNMTGYFRVRHLESPIAVERHDPAFPGASRRLPDRLVAHAGDGGVIRT